jgi:hypothetical protein
MTILRDMEALQALERDLDPEERSRSVYWRTEMDTFFINAEGEFSGHALVGNMGPPPDPLRNIAHWLLQTPIRRHVKDCATFPECHRLARRIAARQNRQFTLDIRRQALSLALIRHHLPKPRQGEVTAVIGDGFGVMTGLLHLCWPDRKVLLCNLNKPLLTDLAFLRKAMPDIRIALARDRNDMAALIASDSVDAIAVQADNAAIMEIAPIALAINILSMQEMRPEEIATYFEVLRRYPAPRTGFYCANHLCKILHDGSTVRFDEYPWRDEDEILLNEPCEWSQLIYQKSPPFWITRGRSENKLVVHRIAWLQRDKAGSS